MIDNFIKEVLLTPDVIFDTTVEEMGIEEIYKVFKQYEKLDNLSTDNLLKNNGRLSFLEIPNSLFNHITSKIVIMEGQLKLASYMHIFKDKQKIVLCIPYKKFLKMVIEYKETLIRKQTLLIRDLNVISEEILFVSKLNLEVGVSEEIKKEEKLSE